METVVTKERKIIRLSIIAEKIKVIEEENEKGVSEVRGDVTVSRV